MTTQAFIITDEQLQELRRDAVSRDDAATVSLADEAAFTQGEPYLLAARSLYDSYITPGLAGVRARIAEQTREAKSVAEQLLTPDSRGRNRMMRDGLRHVCGMTASTFPPEQPVIDSLGRLGLVELADPEATPVCGRYRPTDLGAEVLGLIGVRG